MFGIPKKNLALGTVLLLGFGLLRLPLELGIERELDRQGFIEDAVGLSMMEELGQDGFAAVLGGFRPLVASAYYLVAHTSAFDRNDWGRVDHLFGLITALQPRNGHYWDQYVWHMGWNAYAWATNEADYQSRLGKDWEAWTLEKMTAPGFLDRAEQVAIRGATMVRDDYRFYQRVGLFYEGKLEDVCEAARWFQRGSQVEGAPGFMHNIFAIFLSQCEGSENEAYPLISKRYWDPDRKKRALSVLIQMESLEDRLAQRELDERGIDEVRRLSEAEPEQYLHRATLAKYYAEVEGDPAMAMGVYEDMLRPGGVLVPGFYRKKWALLAAGFPEREVVAYRTLREQLIETRRRLTPEEEAVVRPLEERLDIPEKARLFKGKKNPKPSQSE
jgi:hypothetical protein